MGAQGLSGALAVMDTEGPRVWALYNPERPFLTSKDTQGLLKPRGSSVKGIGPQSRTYALGFQILPSDSIGFHDKKVSDSIGFCDKKVSDSKKLRSRFHLGFY